MYNIEEIKNTIICGDCLEVLKKFPENSVDSIVTDPPYELGFMGKYWDATGIAYSPILWKQCYRILKPGGHLLAFSGTRTYHRMACAIEDAGFEVRDMIEWVYGSGFPKSLNIGKAVDKLQGNEREETGEIEKAGFIRAGRTDEEIWLGGTPVISSRPKTKGTSEWEGWGTALKPAHEPICMARKPLSEKTVAENVLKYGTGGINIDESRVDYNGETPNIGGRANHTRGDGYGFKELKENINPNTQGRFPANLIHDNSEEVRECFPEAKGGAYPKERGKSGVGFASGRLNGDQPAHQMGDSGNASRFFKSILYYPKASKSERNNGCEGLEEKQYSHDGREKEIENPYQRNKSVATNNHPTVKPIALMEYLIKMVTPKGGIVLDQFTGSGSTLVAAKENNFKYIGIEKEQEYVKIANARLKAVRDKLL